MGMKNSLPGGSVYVRYHQVVLHTHGKVLPVVAYVRIITGGARCSVDPVAEQKKWVFTRNHNFLN